MTMDYRKPGIRHFVCPIVFGLLAGCNATEPGTSAETSTPSCSLLVADSFTAGSPVKVGLELHNPGEEAIEVLQYFTPLEGILGSVYRVSFQGESLDYLGPMVKRMPPGDEDWLPLPAGDSLSTEVQINNAWDLSRAGDYRIELSNDISYRASPAAETRLLSAESCGSTQFMISR